MHNRKLQKLSVSVLVVFVLSLLLIIKRVDAADPWTLLKSFEELKYIKVGASSDGTMIYVAQNDGYIHFSSNSGSTWVTSTEAFGPQYWLSIASTDSGVSTIALVTGTTTADNAGGFYNDYYLSQDSGATWPTSGAIEVSTTTPHSSGQDIAVSSDFSYYSSAVTGGNLEILTSVGELLGTASDIDNNYLTEQWYSTAMSSDGVSVIGTHPGPSGYSTDIVYTSTTGATWLHQALAGQGANQAVTEDGMVNIPINETYVAMSSDGSKWFAAVKGDYIYKSSDYGVTWQKITGAMTTQTWKSVAVSGNGLRLFAGTDNGELYGFDVADSYSLLYSAGNNGNLTGTTTQIILNGDDGEPVTAVPDSGYHFVDWSDGSTANPRADTGITANISVSANFDVGATYTLSYSAGTGGSLTGSVSQAVISGSDGTAVTAVPASGYSFVRWSDGSTTNPRTDLAVGGNLTISAVFEASSSGGGSGGGVIIGMPRGIGDGVRDAAGTMGSSLDVGEITSGGVNILTYINNLNIFSLPESSHGWQFGRHSLQITNLDLANFIVTFTISSTPQSVTLKLDESKYLDLDGDKIADASVTFFKPYSNRAEITVKSLDLATGVVVSATGGEIVKVNAKNRPGVYYVQNGRRYLFVNRDTYTSWSAAAGDSGNRFATLKTITQVEFEALPVGGNLVARPGSLIKFDDSALVYVVGGSNKLYQLADATAQSTLYGSIKPYVIQAGFKADYYNNGKAVSVLTAASQKPADTIN